jgi:hypothetical protein
VERDQCAGQLSSEFQLIVYDLGFAAEIVEQLMF